MHSSVGVLIALSPLRICAFKSCEKETVYETSVVVALSPLAGGTGRVQEFSLIQGYPAHRKPIGHIAHYMKTQKEILAMDALTTAAINADVIVTNRCQHIGAGLGALEGRSNGCVGLHAFLGKHPSDARSSRMGLGYIGAIVTLKRLAWRNAPTRGEFHAMWLSNALISGLATGDAIRDWHAGDDLANARAKLLK